ncbi:MAG: hypothetical protein AB7O21_06910 [Gammaproteobacteria bacterium]
MGTVGDPPRGNARLNAIAERAGSRARRLPVLVFAGALAIYCAGYLAWYATTALGRMPVLDEREVLAMATQIAHGTLPREAFYRAPLYPALLALPLALGLDAAWLAPVARLLNGLLHLATAWLAWRTAGMLWQSRSAQYIAAALVGFNPVLLHFAGDALDITCALMLFVGGLGALVRAARAPAVAGHWCSAGTWLAIGVLVRPQLLSVAVVLPVLALVANRQRARMVTACAAAAPLAAALLGFGTVNAYLADDFRLLPWQGAFNFWAANHARAHGRYFVQTLPVHTVDPAANTARLESTLLYRRATGDRAGDYRAQTAYWESRGRAAIADDPIGWLRRLARKAFYLWNNVEQYNNKTYAFHRARSPWLRVNPLGWWLVLGLATLGAVRGAGRRDVRWVLVAAAAYAAGTLLYYVSDRFRVPLVGAGAVLAGGSASAFVAAATHWRAWLLAIALGGGALMPLPRALREETFVQDHLALGRAYSELGEHAAAQAAAEAALRLAPRRRAAQALVCVARFNAWLHGAAPLTARQRESWTPACAAAAVTSPTAARVLGYLDWHAGRRETAVSRWARLVDARDEDSPAALAWLVLAGATRPADEPVLARARRAAHVDVLVLALSYREGGDVRERVRARWPAERLAREEAAFERLFGPQSRVSPAEAPSWSAPARPNG